MPITTSASLAPVASQLQRHESGQLESSTGYAAAAENQANAAHRLQSIGENPLPATVSWMFIRPLRLPSDRAAVSEFLHEQARRGLPGLSENKHALIEYDGDRPGTGLVAEGQDGGVVAYVGLAPAADGYWAMEIVTSQPDPRPLVAAAVETVGERRSRGIRWWVYGGPLAEWPERLGFAPERRLLIMARDLPATDEPQFPDGFSILPFRPGVDEETWLESTTPCPPTIPKRRPDVEDLERRMAMDCLMPTECGWSGRGRGRGVLLTKIHPSGEGRSTSSA